MNTKRILLTTIVLTLLAWPELAFSSEAAHQAIALNITGAAGEQAIAALPAYGPRFTTAETDVTILPAAAVIPRHYPRLYRRYSPEMVIYRKNYDEPIRDFRYYRVKSVPNEVIAKKNVPLRDFRFDYWEDKYYR